jgi:hypothetical protein
MPDQEHEYDVFLSHAGEDTAWCETLAERLRNDGVRVWFDKWELQPGDHLLARLNDGLKKSRKMAAVWSANYFRDDKVWTLAESFSRQHDDALSHDRPIIPILIQDCDILPTFRNLISIPSAQSPGSPSSPTVPLTGSTCHGFSEGRTLQRHARRSRSGINLW